MMKMANHLSNFNGKDLRKYLNFYIYVKHMTLNIKDMHKEAFH